MLASTAVASGAHYVDVYAGDRARRLPGRRRPLGRGDHPRLLRAAHPSQRHRDGPAPVVVAAGSGDPEPRHRPCSPLVATPGNGQVALSWTPPADDGAAPSPATAPTATAPSSTRPADALVHRHRAHERHDLPLPAVGAQRLGAGALTDPGGRARHGPVERPQPAATAADGSVSDGLVAAGGERRQRRHGLPPLRQSVSCCRPPSRPANARTSTRTWPTASPTGTRSPPATASARGALQRRPWPRRSPTSCTAPQRLATPASPPRSVGGRLGDLVRRGRRLPGRHLPPTRNLKRSQAVAFLWHLLDSPAPRTGRSPTCRPRPLRRCVDRSRHQRAHRVPGRQLPPEGPGHAALARGHGLEGTGVADGHRPPRVHRRSGAPTARRPPTGPTTTASSTTRRRPPLPPEGHHAPRRGGDVAAALAWTTDAWSVRPPRPPSCF